MKQGKEAASQAMDQAAQAAAQADRATSSANSNAEDSADIPKEPRRIEILDDEDDEPTPPPAAHSQRPSPTPDITPETSIRDLHDQVAVLKEELKRLRRDR
jgi:hypothetical protein